MSTCAQCGHQNAKHYRFCLGCGAELPQLRDEEEAAPKARRRSSLRDAFSSAEPAARPAALISAAPDAVYEEAPAVMGLPLPAALDPALDPALDSALDSALPPLTAEDDLPPPLPAFEAPSEPAPAALAELMGAGGGALDLPFDFRFQDQPSAQESPAQEAPAQESPAQESPAPKPPALQPQDDAAPAARAPQRAEEAEETYELSSSSLAAARDARPAAPAVTPAAALSPAPPAPAVSVRAAAQAPRVCKHCFAVVPKGFAFCGGCGTRYDEDLRHEPAHHTPPPLGVPAKTAETQYLRLVHIHPDGSEGEALSLNIKQATLGRDYPWPIFQRDPYLSPKHVTFFFQGQSVYLRDEGGLNGTFVKLKGTAELHSGDLFRAGQQLFRFERIKPGRGAPSTDGTRRLGSPTYQTWGRLAHVVGHGELGRAWMLSDSTLDIGRVRGAITFEQDRFMSGAHCTLSFAEERATLTDKGSTNGTFLRVQGNVPLSQNDLVLLGQQIFRVDLGLV